MILVPCRSTENCSLGMRAEAWEARAQQVVSECCHGTVRDGPATGTGDPTAVHSSL